MIDIASAVKAELEAEDAQERAELERAQQRRRDALVPAIALHREIEAERERFHSRDRDLLAKLAETIKEARKHGAPKARLDALSIEPLDRKRAQRRPKKTSTPAAPILDDSTHPPVVSTLTSTAT